jgi:bacterioferritin (cytochrome b1)
MISQHLAAGRATINSYRQIAALFDAFDPASKKLIDDIVCAEEACVSQLASLLDESSTAKKGGLICGEI